MALIANVIIFEGGNALCDGALNMTGMVLGRVIKGVRGSGMYMSYLMLLAIITTTKDRPVYMGV